jgi:hypothetical protein
MPDKENRPTIAAIDELTADADPIELSAEDFEKFIDSPPKNIERLVTMILVDQLDEAKRIYFEAYQQDRVHAVTEFLLRGLFVFTAGFQRFSALGKLIMLRREGVLLEDTPSLNEAVRAKLDECRPVVEGVVRRFSPVLNDPDAVVQMNEPNAVVQSVFKFD